MQNRPQVLMPHPMQFLLAYINHKVKSDAYLEPTPLGAQVLRGHRMANGGRDGALNSSMALLGRA